MFPTSPWENLMEREECLAIGRGGSSAWQGKGFWMEVLWTQSILVQFQIIVDKA